MPFVKCLPGFAEVPYQVPPWSLHVAPRMPKNKPKEAYLVPAPKARLYPKRLIRSYCEVPPRLQGVQRDRTRDSPLSPENALKNVLGTRLEGTFECKARLENAECCCGVENAMVGLKKKKTRKGEIIMVHLGIQALQTAEIPMKQGKAQQDLTIHQPDQVLVNVPFRIESWISLAWRFGGPMATLLGHLTPARGVNPRSSNR